jgi:uncharacterized protein YkwD
MMRSLTVLPLLAALAACGSLALGAPPGAGDLPGRPAPVATAPAGAVERMAVLVNRHRSAAGCPPLAWLDGAARAAQAHSDDMAARGYFDHRSPEGVDLGERLSREGVVFRSAGENIAHSPQQPDAVLQGWLNSRGHRQNLEFCAYTHHGLGVSAGRWTHVLVTPLAT